MRQFWEGMLQRCSHWFQLAWAALVLPESVKRIALTTVAFMEIPDLKMTQHWELVWRADNRSSSLMRFINVVTRYFGDSSESISSSTDRRLTNSERIPLF